MIKNITKFCKHHGESIFFKNGKGYRCRTCWNENIIRRRVEFKRRAVKYAGGCCVNCGYSKNIVALDFHHVDPSTKLFSLSTAYTRSWKAATAEIDKCILVCANCHRELHFGLDYSIYL